MGVGIEVRNSRRGRFTSRCSIKIKSHKELILFFSDKRAAPANRVPRTNKAPITGGFVIYQLVHFKLNVALASQIIKELLHAIEKTI